MLFVFALSFYYVLAFCLVWAVCCGVYLFVPKKGTNNKMDLPDSRESSVFAFNQPYIIQLVYAKDEEKEVFADYSIKLSDLVAGRSDFSFLDRQGEHAKEVNKIEEAILEKVMYKEPEEEIDYSTMPFSLEFPNDSEEEKQVIEKEDTSAYADITTAI